MDKQVVEMLIRACKESKKFIEEQDFHESKKVILFMLNAAIRKAEELTVNKSNITIKKLEVTDAYYAIIETDGVETQTRYRDNVNDVRLDVEAALEMKRLEKKFLTRTGA